MSPLSPAHTEVGQNTEHLLLEEHFRNNLGIPLLDGIIVNMDQRFSDNTRRTSKLLYLVPSMLIQETFDMSVLEDVIEEYKDDIPNPDILEMEIKNWRSVFLLLPTEQVPTTIASAVKSINAINFPMYLCY